MQTVSVHAFAKQVGKLSQILVKAGYCVNRNMCVPVGVFIVKAGYCVNRNMCVPVGVFIVVSD